MDQKKRKWLFVSAALLLTALLLLAVSVFGAEGGSADPLVSLGFLNGSYRSTILSEVENKLRLETNAMSQKLNQQIDAVRLSGAQKSNVQPTHTTVTVSASTSYTAPSGSEFLVLSGVLDCGSATLTDVASGTRLNANELLEVNHLYVATASTVLRATETAQILIRKP